MGLERSKESDGKEIAQKIEFGDEVKEYLQLKKASTASAYAVQLRRFLRYYKVKCNGDIGFSHFFDRLDENQKVPRRERKLLAESEMNEYIEFLKKEGYANNSIRLNFTAIQNLLKYKGYGLDGRWVGNLPPPVTAKKNQKHEWTLDNIREFVGVADNFRDKAIIMVMFQSGVGIDELYNLDYGNVEHELKIGKLPLCLRVVRKKRGTEYKTFLGADAIKYLKLYLDTRKNLRSESPLFTKLGTEERLEGEAIQWRFRVMAKDLSFVTVKDGEYNPARPHSIRTAFRSRLTGKMDRDVLEFFMGHAISTTKAAYINLPTDELRELYAQFEHELSIETTSKKMEMEAGKEGSVLSQVAVDKIASLENRNKVLEGMIKDLDKRTRKEKGELGAQVLMMSEKITELEEKLEKGFWNNYEKYLDALVKKAVRAERTDAAKVEKSFGKIPDE